MEGTTLYLFIKREHFDNIYNGNKTREYRKKVPHYIYRIEGYSITRLVLINGYHKDARRLTVEVKEIRTITKQWGQEQDAIPTYEFILGSILKTENF